MAEKHDIIVLQIPFRDTRQGQQNDDPTAFTVMR